MKKIPLTRGKFALIDDEDYEWLNQWKWQAHRDGYSGDFSATRREKIPGKKTRKTIIMSREIMNTPKGMKCDHKNHNTLDNRKSNLRNCTHAQNMRNHKGAYKNSTTGVLGVTPTPCGFRGAISINGKMIFFPVRKTIEQAKKDREEAEKKYYGEFSPNK